MHYFLSSQGLHISMKNDLHPLEERLSQEPIRLPKNPFLEALEVFGTDEAISMVINVAGTAAIDRLIKQGGLESIVGPLSKTAKDLVISTAGPIIEKFGFFPAHFKRARDEYLAAPEGEREHFSHYLKQAIRGGASSLAKDIIVHDPIYFGLMFGGMQMYPQTPAWMLAGTSFVMAVFAVAGLTVAVNEAKYWNLKRSLRNTGFGSERYYEARFFISSDDDPKKTLNRLVDEFKLSPIRTLEYRDRYFETSLPHYSNRTPKLRLRRRTNPEGGPEMRTAQIVFTRAAEMKSGKAEQCRYFPSLKEKLYFPLDNEKNMPSQFSELKESKARDKLIGAVEGDDHYDVRFTRMVAKNPATLLISADHVADDRRPFYVLEVKTYGNTDALLEAMRHIMRTCDVHQITYGKLDLDRLLRKAVRSGQ